MRALTERQRQVLDYLHRHLQAHGLPPTLHELMHAFGWASPAGAAKHLQALAARGLIELSPGKARGIRLLEGAAKAVPSHDGSVAGQPGAPKGGAGNVIEGHFHGGARNGGPDGTDPEADTLLLPLVGRVAAGRPILAGGRIERHLKLDRWLFSPRPDFLLRVQGDSMIDDGILDGDLVAGKATPQALHGQIVIARVDGGITIKRLWQRDGRLRLLPRNARHAPIDPSPWEDFAIEGIYCGLLRRP